MSIRLVPALLLLAAPAGAAPLCHDLRGLYTPCAPGQAGSPHRRAVHAGTERTARADTVVASAAPAAPAKPAKPALFDRAKKFCHDSKGLYTPCPR